MKPTIGRTVHFRTYGTPGGEHPPQTIAAIITGVHLVQRDDETTSTYEVDLFAMYPNGTSHKSGIRFAEEPTPGCWSWPPQV